jgi:hypothetical protein
MLPEISWGTNEPDEGFKTNFSLFLSAEICHILLGMPEFTVYVISGDTPFCLALIKI